ncbi:MAG: chemotaxis protein, partial [Anaerolineaceae bacterium]
MNQLKKISNFIFDQKITQTLILRLAASIPIILIISSIIYLALPATQPYILPPIILILIMISSILLIFLSQFIKGTKLIDKTAITLSQGNLNIDDIIPEKTKGLEVLTSAFNDMKRNLLSYIESTKSNVIILSDAVEKVTQSIDMTYKGNELIATNISVVAEKSQEQLKIAKQTLEGIEKVSLAANSITNTLGSIENFVDNTASLTSEGAGHVEKYTEQVQLISTNLDETSNFIQTLNANLAKINEFGNVIIDITNQLNLLSMNSRIEAARAGEAGKGFSVVAMEMSKLSNATKDSATQINNLLDNIINSNTKVSDSIENVTNSFVTSQEIFNSVKDSFYTINNNANILNSDIKKVYEESIMISENTKEISYQGTSLHDSSIEISNITQDVAAITEESLAENEQINEQAKSLTKMLSSIENLLKRYRTSVLPVKEASAKRLKITMMSTINDSFGLSVRQGALYAQTELKDKNVEIDFIGFQKVDQNFHDTLDNKIEEGCDGLVLPGFIDGIEEGIKKARDKKIPVMIFNCDIEDKESRLSYFGPNIHAEGTLAAEILAGSIEKEGEVIIFSGNTSSPINTIRRDAAVAKLTKYSDIKIASEINDIEANVDVYKKLKEIFYYKPNVRALLFIGEGAPGAARAIEEMGLVGKTKIICLNYNEELENLIKKGIVHKVFRQDPFGQGHDPIIYLYNYLVANETPESSTYTRTEVIDQFSVGGL